MYLPSSRSDMDTYKWIISGNREWKSQLNVLNVRNTCHFSPMYLIFYCGFNELLLGLIFWTDTFSNSWLYFCFGRLRANKWYSKKYNEHLHAFTFLFDFKMDSKWPKVQLSDFLTFLFILIGWVCFLCIFSFFLSIKMNVFGTCSGLGSLPEQGYCYYQFKNLFEHLRSLHNP